MRWDNLAVFLEKKTKAGRQVKRVERGKGYSGGSNRDAQLRAFAMVLVWGFVRRYFPA